MWINTPSKTSSTCPIEEGVAPEGGLFSGPVRRRLSPDDDFFDAGNIQRAVLCKMSVFSLEGGDGGDMMDQDSATYLDGRSYNCRFNKCRATFSSLAKVSLALPLHVSTTP